jgi:hypothetical protein
MIWDSEASEVTGCETDYWLSDLAITQALWPN